MSKTEIANTSKREVSGCFKRFVLMCIYILTTPKASGVTQDPVIDDVCGAEQLKWMDDIIVNHFCLDEMGEISLVNDNKVICDFLDVPSEEKKMISRKAEPCTSEMASPLGKIPGRCGKKKVQPPPSQKKSICKEGEKLRVQSTTSGIQCVAEKALPKFIEDHVVFSECKESRTLIKTTSESPSIAEAAASAKIRRAVAICGGNEWMRHENKNNLCLHEGSAYLWDIPSLFRLCRVDIDSSMFAVQECPEGARQFMKELVALAARNVDASKIPGCTSKETNYGNRYRACFLAGTYYMWKPPLNVCKRTIKSQLRKWEYCGSDAIRVMQVVSGTMHLEDSQDGSVDVAKTFMICSKYMLQKSYSSKDDRCLFEGWVFLWLETTKVLCLVSEHKIIDEALAACAKGAVHYIEKVKELSRTQIDMTSIPVCSEDVVKNSRIYTSCFFKSLYLVVIKNNGGHVCNIPIKDKYILPNQYCLEDELEMIKRVVDAATSDRSGPAPNAQRYRVTMELSKRPAPADDVAVGPQSKRIRRNIGEMVSVSCPPGAFLGIQDYTITPSGQNTNQKRSPTKTDKQDTEFVANSNKSTLLAEMRQNKRLADGYQIAFTVLVRKDVAEETDFSQVQLLRELKANSRVFDGGAYVIEPSSIEVSKVSGKPPNGAWGTRTAWVVAGVTCAALVLLIIIIVSCRIRSRKLAARKRRYRNRMIKIKF